MTHSISVDLVSTRIRPATRDDVGVILSLVKELALYEKEPSAVVATEEDFLRDGFGADPKFRVLLAELTEEPHTAPGFAFYFFKYSTWEGRSVLHLEDLFVRPEFRSRGIGLALMKALARVAIDAQCTRFEWQVLDWNAGAKTFYEKLGAKILTSWEPVRVDGDALRALARG